MYDLFRSLITLYYFRASLEPHIAMVHEGVRKKCEICNKVLSDLNKHMRTVHGTYRRKAKIPKDLINEIDNPDSELLPQLYASAPASSGLSPEKPSLTIDQNIPKQQVSKPSKKRKAVEPVNKTLPENNNYQLEHDRSTQSIKAELGLSSGITLQKIVRQSPIKAPPKLTYHGPPMMKKVGSIEITPMSQTEARDAWTDESSGSQSNIPRLVKKPQQSSMVKISGKYSQNMI